MNTLLILLLILHTSTSAFSIISGDPANTTVLASAPPPPSAFSIITGDPANTTVLASAPPPPPPPTWSGFYLSLLWPPGYCLIHNICDRHKIKEDFTIHGLWPQTPAGQQLPSAPLYDDSLIYPSLRRNLRRNWPNYRRRSRDEAFWRHEWNQHGIVSNHLMNEVTYFQTALALHLSRNMTLSLATHNIFPNDAVGVYAGFVNQAFSTILQGNSPLFICRMNPADGMLYLIELRVCFDAAATNSPINCHQTNWSCLGFPNPLPFIIKRA